MKKRFFNKKFVALNSLFGIQMSAFDKANNYAKANLINDDFYILENGEVTIFFSQEDVDRTRRFVLKKMEKDPKYMGNLIKDAFSGFNKFKKNCDSYIKEIENSKTSDQLRWFIKKFCDIASNTTSLAFIPEFFAGYDEYWIDYLGVSKDNFHILTTPNNISFTKEYELELAKIKLEKSRKTIKDIVSKYYWIQSNYKFIDLVNEESVTKDLSEITKEKAEKIINETKKTSAELPNKKKELIKKLGLNDFQIKILDILAKSIYLQDCRKEIIVKTSSIFSKAGNKLLDIYNFSAGNKNIIMSAAFPTWFVDLEKQELLKKSKETLTGFYWSMKNGFLFGNRALVKAREIESENQSGEINQIKGLCANKGYVKGRVKIILDAKCEHNFKKDDILVTSMTRPEFVPFMKMASAFITDEGGITCHAAIVARELNKPCIIGTKIVTQVLKDGDFVEVDADNGIVKIIK